MKLTHVNLNWPHLWLQVYILIIVAALNLYQFCVLKNVSDSLIYILIYQLQNLTLQRSKGLYEG